MNWYTTLTRSLWTSGPPRFDGERRFGGDRDGYRGQGGDFSTDKAGAPADYRPSFGVSVLLLTHILVLHCKWKFSTLCYDVVCVPYCLY